MHACLILKIFEVFYFFPQINRIKKQSSFQNAFISLNAQIQAVKYIKYRTCMNHHSAIDKAVRLARLVGTEGFSDMTADEVNNLIECHSNPLTDEDLEEMTRSASERKRSLLVTKVTKLKNVALHYIICNTSSILPKASKKGPKKWTTTWSEPSNSGIQQSY